MESDPAVEPPLAPLDEAPSRLRIGVVGEPTFDPVQAAPGNAADMMVLDVLYDGLTEWNASIDSWQLALASEVTGNAESDTWTFVLPAGLTFSDGTALTAQDFERSIERVLADRRSLASLRLDMIEGMDQPGTDLAGITAIDDLTLEIQLVRPFSGLPAALSSPIFGAVPERTEIDGTVVSGPMYFDGRRGGALWLEHRDSGPGTIGAVIQVLESVADAQAMVSAGQLDIAPLDDETADALLVTRSVQIHYAMNVNHWKLADPQVRAAVQAAIDRAAITDEVYAGTAIPLHGLTAQDADCSHSCAAAADVSALLEGAFDGGQVPIIHVDYVDSPDGEAAEGYLAAEVARQLTEAGIPAVPRGHSLLQFVDLVSSGDHELYRAGWVGLSPSTESRLGPYVSDSPDNTSGYANTDFDTFMETGSAMFDGSVMFDNAWAVLAESDVVVPLVTRVQPMFVDPRVRGLEFRFDGSFSVENVTLDS